MPTCANEVMRREGGNEIGQYYYSSRKNKEYLGTYGTRDKSDWKSFHTLSELKRRSGCYRTTVILTVMQTHMQTQTYTDTHGLTCIDTHTDTNVY